jgi:mono/diheme cytochrome c family protein
MNMRARCLSAALIVWPLVAAAAAAGPETDQLAARARGVLKQHCHRCHGLNFEVEGFDVLDHKGLLAPREGDKRYVEPGQPAASAVYHRLAVRNNMPPRSVRERPSDEDKEVIRRWIEAGAPPFPAAEARRFVSTGAVLEAVRADLARANAGRRGHLRYFTLTHLHNNPAVAEADLRLTRAALAKVLNSLTWEPAIVLPRAVDRAQTVFAVDVGELGWDPDKHWRAVMKQYPYGLDYTGNRNPRLAALDKVITTETDCEVPVVRADWFVAAATQPPVYHVLLDLPENARVLEQRLGVDVLANFRAGRLARAGFAASGVSGQNRLVERHLAGDRAYWKSYDFKARTPRNVLTRFPLGPEFDGHPFPQQAFRHAGGEIIFHLPNALQGYLLVNNKDERIDAGPVEIVSDSQKTGGTPAVLNGLSCMSCHKHGMLPFKDAVRDGTAVGGDALALVRRLYPAQDDMDRLVRQDADRFLTALGLATGSFLRLDEDRQRPLRDFPEPVGEVARTYLLKDLGPAEAAYELGLDGPDRLRALIDASRALRALGLAPLAAGRSIRRDEWETLDGTSLFQKVAHELQLGTPLRPVN